MNSETAIDIFINESVEQNVHNIPSPDIQVVTAPDLGSSSSNQQDRAAPNTGATRTIRRMSSSEAFHHAFGER